MAQSRRSTAGGVDPATVPTRLLRTGDLLPAIGLGTFGSDHVGHDTVARSVADAVRLGYRHLDCAAVYGNEAAIGRSLAGLVGSGVVARDDLWITSKVWNDMHGPGDVGRDMLGQPLYEERGPHDARVLDGVAARLPVREHLRRPGPLPAALTGQISIGSDQLMSCCGRFVEPELHS